MAKVTVTLKLSILERLAGSKPFLLTSDLEDIGKAIVSMAKQMIESGQSPVRDFGRFEAYQAQRTGAVKKIKSLESQKKKSIKAFKNKKNEQSIKSLHYLSARLSKKNIEQTKAKNYPYSVQKKYPGKKVRPVNLELSGDMLKMFTFDVVGKNQVNVGMIHADGKILTIAIAHNEGPTNGAFPQRKFIASKEGEDYAVSIQREVKALFSAAIDRVISESNK